MRTSSSARSVVSSRRDRVVAGRLEVRDAREVLQHRGRPAPRRTRADAEAVVLADEQQRAVAVHVREVRRRVERAGRGRVVHRRVAEACDDQRVLRPRRLAAQRFRQSQGEAEPDRARQVRGDRRRLRDDVQPRVAEHLVPAARDRVGRGAGEAAQRLADRVDAPVQVRAGGVERHPSGSAAARGRWSATAGRRRRSTRDRPSRSCRSQPLAAGAIWPRSRGAGSRPGRRRGLRAGRPVRRRPGAARPARGSLRRCGGSARRWVPRKLRVWHTSARLERTALAGRRPRYFSGTRCRRNSGVVSRSFVVRSGRLSGPRNRDGGVLCVAGCG